MRTIESDIVSKLNREVAAFMKQIGVEDYHSEATEPITYEDFLTNKMLIIIAIREGIPYSLFDLIQDYTQFTDNEWANFLNISIKSLRRYKASPEFHFKPIHSEKIIEIAEVTQLGLDVFGNRGKLSLWLNTPNYALGGIEPLELVKDSYGKELVIGELVRINHGILV